MPKKAFALDAGGPPRVEIQWRGIWKDVRVRVDGNELAVIPNKGELERGRDIPLPMGGVLGVKLVSQFAAVELRVTRDGISLPGSASDPAERVRQAAYVLYFIAGLNLVLGLATELGGVEFLRSLGLGWASAAEGLVFGLLGWRTAKRSQIALMLGIALFGVDTILIVVGGVQSAGTFPMGGLVARVLFFMPLIKGLQGFRELKAAAEVAAPTVPGQ
jgi:hypothetical protein